MVFIEKRMKMKMKDVTVINVFEKQMEETTHSNLKMET